MRLRSCAILALFAALPAAAQPYPNQPIKLIAPFPPGGSVDITARLIADPLGKQLGTRVVIENRSGASGNIGMEAAAKAAPDGYTIVLNTLPLVTNQSLFDKLSWDAFKDFAPIGMVATSPHVLVVPNRLAAANVPDLVKMARASPGKLTYASAGVGTTFHICAEMFKDATQTFILHVPYRGGGPALLDTLSGQVDMSFPTMAAALPHVKAATLRALAVTSPERSSLLPGVSVLAVARAARAREHAAGDRQSPQRRAARRARHSRNQGEVRSAGDGSVPKQSRCGGQVPRQRGAAPATRNQDPRHHRGLNYGWNLAMRCLTSRMSSPRSSRRA